MERRRSSGAGESETTAENSNRADLFLSAPPPRPPRRAAHADVKLAAVAVGLRVRPRAADMSPAMQERAFRCARALLDSFPNRRRPNLTLLALALKKASTFSAIFLLFSSRPSASSPASFLSMSRPFVQNFDASYGSAWHCVAGRSFGSYLTHSPGGFVYFSLDGGDDNGDLSVLLFQTRLRPVTPPLRLRVPSIPEQKKERARSLREVQF